MASSTIDTNSNDLYISNINTSIMPEITKHFTTSVYIIHNDNVLLHCHKKLHTILPPGGHIERDELPHLAAMREVKEECGLDVELIQFKSYETFEDPLLENREQIELNVGEFCNLHYINPFHQHIDFIFFAKAFSEIIKPGKDESKEWYWFSKDEIETHTQIKPAVKKYALYALDIANRL